MNYFLVFLLSMTIGGDVIEQEMMLNVGGSWISQ